MPLLAMALAMAVAVEVEFWTLRFRFRSYSLLRSSEPHDAETEGAYCGLHVNVLPDSIVRCLYNKQHCHNECAFKLLKNAHGPF